MIYVFTVIEGGPLQSTYQLKQFHFHWGANDLVGSEHKIDDKTFSGEVNIAFCYLQ